MPVQKQKLVSVPQKQYNELLSLYNDLKSRLRRLQQESMQLKLEIQEIRDKKKVKDILQKIVSQPD